MILQSFLKLKVKSNSVPVKKVREKLSLNQGDEIPAGEKITDGPINPHDILKIKGTNAVQEYLVNEIQDVYRLQGVKINDKHIEVIVKQMLQKLQIISAGDTNFIEEDLVDRNRLLDENDRVMNMSFIIDAGQSKFKAGQLITKAKLREVNADLTRKGKKLIEGRDAEPGTFDNILLGITHAALSTESFISAASFQETTKVLTNAATEARTDTLVGLKENVVMGHLIPAGTGLKKYKEIILSGDEEETPAPVTEETPEVKESV